MLTLSSIAWTTLFVKTALSLRVSSGSPCWDTCSVPSTNTTGDDIVCRDLMYSDTRVGRRFEECVSCELESTHFLKRYDESDVEWGLYNLRYVISSCIFAYPEEKQSISTPCQVSCESLRDAVGYGLRDPNGFTSYDFCDLNSFEDAVITKCTECYSQTEDEKYLANFLEAIRQGCHSQVEPGFPFILDPTRIFNTDRIPASTESVSPNSEDDGDRKPKNLVLIIVLPIVGFILLVGFSCCGCFFLVRHRRRKAREHSQSGRLHERWNDTSIITPFPGGLRKLWNGDPAENQQVAPHNQYGAYNPGFYQPEQQQQQQHNMDIKYPPEAYMMDTSPSHQQPYPHPEQYPQHWPQPMLPTAKAQYAQQPHTTEGQIQQTTVAVKQDAEVPILSAPPARKSLGSKPEKSDS